MFAFAFIFTWGPGQGQAFLKSSKTSREVFSRSSFTEGAGFKDPSLCQKYRCQFPPPAGQRLSLRPCTVLLVSALGCWAPLRAPRSWAHLALLLSIFYMLRAPISESAPLAPAFTEGTAKSLMPGYSYGVNALGPPPTNPCLGHVQRVVAYCHWAPTMCWSRYISSNPLSNPGR